MIIDDIRTADKKIIVRKTAAAMTAGSTGHFSHSLMGTRLVWESFTFTSLILMEKRYPSMHCDRGIFTCMFSFTELIKIISMQKTVLHGCL